MDSDNNHFTISIQNTDIQNTNIYNMIDDFLEQMRNNPDMFQFDENSENEIHLDIHFEYITTTPSSNENNTFFQNCSEINNLLSKSYKIKKDDPILSESCQICFEKYKVGELKRILPKCNHFFHKKCVDKWLKKKGNCPICRHNYAEQNTNVEEEGAEEEIEEDVEELEEEVEEDVEEEDVEEEDVEEEDVEEDIIKK
jgi:hypothetical protein